MELKNDNENQKTTYGYLYINQPQEILQIYDKTMKQKPNALRQND